MNKHAIISTRDENKSQTLQDLEKYYEEAGFTVHTVEGASSMLEAYNSKLKELEIFSKDIIVFSHDDIEILVTQKMFNTVLEETLANKKIGFAGVAGTKLLSEEATWWDMDLWRQGLHSGMVMHGDDFKKQTIYGPHGDVVVCDGVFMACTGKTIKSLDFKHPEYLPKGWDFYDLHLSILALEENLKNMVMPLLIRHASGGMGAAAPAGDWQENRSKFKEKWGEKLPLMTPHVRQVIEQLKKQQREKEQTIP